MNTNRHEFRGGFEFSEFVFIDVYSWLRHHDLGTDSTIIPRFLSRETAHHRAVVIAFARRSESAFHQRRDEPVCADFSRPTESAVDSAARSRHAEVHPRRRQA